MHQLLGNTAHIDARATEAPGGARWRWLHKVTDSHLLAEGGGSLGAGEAARAAADHLMGRASTRGSAGCGTGGSELRAAPLRAGRLGKEGEANQ